MSLEQRTAALLAAIDAQRAQRCEALRAPARAQAQAQIAAALREARRRVSTTLASERARAAALIVAADAQRATALRLQRQQADALHLSQAWQRLRERLQALWDEPATRARWIDHHAGSADLPAGAHLRLEGPTDWPAAEVDALVRRLHSRGAVEVRSLPDVQIRAGFRLTGEHNRLDATLDGLLAERAALEGQLLARLAEVPR